MSKRKAATATQPSRRSKRIAQLNTRSRETETSKRSLSPPIVPVAADQTANSLAMSSDTIIAPYSPGSDSISISVQGISTAVRAVAPPTVLAIPELVAEICQYLDLASLAASLRTNRLFHSEGTTAPLLRPIWFLAPVLEEPRQYQVDLDNQVLRQVTWPVNDEEAQGQDAIAVYQINPTLALVRDQDHDENASPLETFLSLEGHTDLQFPYQSADTSKWFKIRDMQLTKPAVKEVQFNYSPSDEDADKVNLEIINAGGITIGDIIDAVKTRGDAPDDSFLISRLWHRDILLLTSGEIDKLEALLRLSHVGSHCITGPVYSRHLEQQA